MESLNDYMDDLYRQAAESYSLKVDTADWEKVRARLPQINAEVPKRLDRSWISFYKRLFCIMLACLFAWLYTSDTHPRTIFSGDAVRPEVTLYTDSGHPVVASAGHLVARPARIAAVHLLVPARSKPASESKIVPDIPDSCATLDPLLTAGDKSIYSVSDEGEQVIPDHQATPRPSLPTIAGPADTNALQAAGSGEHPQPEKKKTWPTKGRSSPKDTALNKGFYISVLQGPDFSTVRLQSLSAGYSAGILIGYRLGLHLGIETGVLFDWKRYYSEGKYFSKKDAGIPDYITIVHLNGTSQLLEIPLDVRYDFAQSGRSHFFVRAGVGAYLIRKESYGYLDEANGIQWSQSASYKNTGHNLFAILDIGAGYMCKTGQRSSLWIGPYGKLPVNGVGIGRLSVSSIGLYMGFTHSFR